MKKILLVLFIIFSISSLAYCEDFIIKDGLLVKCTKNQEVLRLPESVKKVDENAFNDLDKVRTLYISKNIISCEVFPEKLTEIEVDPENTIYSSKDGVLYDKEKTKIIKYPSNKDGASFIIPETVTFIKGSCFSFQIKLEKIFIPKNVNKIEDTFIFMDSIEAINVSDDNKYFKSIEGVLFNSSLDEIIFYPTAKKGRFYTIPSGVKTIGSGAFILNLNLVEVTIPDSVEIIEDFSFAFSSLKSLTLPKNTKYVGTCAFTNSQIKKISFKFSDYDRVDNFADGWLSSANNLETIVYITENGNIYWDLINDKVEAVDLEGNTYDVTKDFYDSVNINEFN